MPAPHRHESGFGDAPLRSASRAVDLLLAVVDGPPTWGVGEVAARFGWSTSSAHRVLRTLTAAGLLRHDETTRRYGPGPALERLRTTGTASAEGAATAAGPWLQRLAATTGMTATLAVPDGSFTRCVSAVIGAEGPLRPGPLPGERYPAHAGATSRGYFAFLAPEVSDPLVFGTPLARFSGRTPVTRPAVERLFAETRRRGFAVSDGEWDPRTVAAACPVRADGRLVGSLTICRVRRSQPARGHGVPAVRALLEAATGLGRQLAN